jgi:hypothetical protein
MATPSAHRRLTGTLLTTLWKLSGSAKRNNCEVALRTLLRRYPFWSEGHRELAEHALASENITLAYSSALSLKSLTPHHRRAQGNAALLLGRCFLKHGEWSQALSYLKDAHALGVRSPRLLEDQAAAHILGGEFKAALECLNSIPLEELSAEGKAALGFVRERA